MFLLSARVDIRPQFLFVNVIVLIDWKHVAFCICFSIATTLHVFTLNGNNRFKYAWGSLESVISTCKPACK